RSEFEDIPVPNGLTYQPSESTIIESPAVKAARLVYRGRIEVASLSDAMRATLEANGWRYVSSVSAGDDIIQVYEKSRELARGSPDRRLVVHVRRADGEPSSAASDEVARSGTKSARNRGICSPNDDGLNCRAAHVNPLAARSPTNVLTRRCPTCNEVKLLRAFGRLGRFDPRCRSCRRSIQRPAEPPASGPPVPEPEPA